MIFSLMNQCSRAEWKTAAWIDKWTIAESVIKQILQQMVDSTTR